MLVRSALAAVSGLAVIAGGAAAPAFASGGHDDYGDLKIKVCKKVRGDSDEEFSFVAKTDEDRDWFDLEDGYCYRTKLEFDDNKFVLKEDYDDDDWYDPEFRVSGDDERVRYDDGKLVVRFDDDEDRPSLKIVVINKEKHHHHHH